MPSPQPQEAAGRRSYVLASAMTLVGGLLVVMANLAVGIIGNEENPLNLVFYSVLLIGVVGAVWSRFSAAGLARTLRAMAAGQLLLAIVAYALGWAFLPVFTLVYVAWWLTAAHLFAKAAR